MNNESKNSRNIPLAIQREVRQRCGFGCVICGLPLYEYEHMEGWAKVKRHNANEITLLCDQHHREKTGGLLPIEKVKNANNNPFNLKNNQSKPYTLHYSGKKPKAKLGTLTIETNDNGYGTQFIPLLIDLIPIIGFVLTDGHFLLNLKIFNEYNHLVLNVVNNQLVYKADLYDIQLVGRKLTIRKGFRQILLEIIFNTPDIIEIVKADLYVNGLHLTIVGEKITINNVNAEINFKNSTMTAPVGISIGEYRGQSAAYGIEKINRYKIE
ncbi:cell division protein [uncultured Polaribacter sp.]|uniref:cell division protein n=1 Tax=uncultured Polaribacter sp. TaxID=174711 RepID=UPI0026134DF0|nr:cell division protein [uncultured Polaribacter sp.]